MDFEKLEKETPKQQQFREDMEAAGIPLRLYSGRFMYGQETYGVSCGRDVSEHEVYRATEVSLHAESLGKGTILYVR